MSSALSLAVSPVWWDNAALSCFLETQVKYNKVLGQFDELIVASGQAIVGFDELIIASGQAIVGFDEFCLGKSSTKRLHEQSATAKAHQEPLQPSPLSYCLLWVPRKERYGPSVSCRSSKKTRGCYALERLQSQARLSGKV